MMSGFGQPTSPDLQNCSERICFGPGKSCTLMTSSCLRLRKKSRRLPAETCIQSASEARERVRSTGRTSNHVSHVFQHKNCLPSIIPEHLCGLVFDVSHLNHKRRLLLPLPQWPDSIDGLFSLSSNETMRQISVELLLLCIRKPEQEEEEKLMYL